MPPVSPASGDAAILGYRDNAPAVQSMNVVRNNYGPPNSADIATFRGAPVFAVSGFVPMLAVICFADECRIRPHMQSRRWPRAM